jgi:chaperonin GroES
MIIVLARVMLLSGGQDINRDHEDKDDCQRGCTKAGYFTAGGSTMRIRPFHDRILIERVEKEDKTTRGIIIPDTAKEKPVQGKVLAVGKGKVTEDGEVIPLDVKKGDQILFSKYAGTEVKIEGKEHLIIREDDVLGIIDK